MTEGTAAHPRARGRRRRRDPLCDLDGANGRLAYGGYDIDELARQATFEEVCLPPLARRAAEAAPSWTASRVAAHRPRARSRAELIAGLPRSCRRTPTRCACSRPRSPSSACTIPTPPTTRAPPTVRKAVRLTSQIATAICAHHRVRSGQEPVDAGAPDLVARRQLPLHAHRASAPARPRVKAFDASLTLYAEHELNASTFTTRVIVATLSDMHSAVAGGVGALKGPLHGGAGEAVMRTLMEIGEVDQRRRVRATRRSRRSGGSWASATASTRRAIRARPSCRGMAEEACRAVRPVQVVRDGGEAPRARSTRRRS